MNYRTVRLVFHYCIALNKNNLDVNTTYRGQIESPAVGQVHLDEAVELLAHPLQADQVLQR